MPQEQERQTENTDATSALSPVRQPDVTAETRSTYGINANNTSNRNDIDRFERLDGANAIVVDVHASRLALNTINYRQARDQAGECGGGVATPAAETALRQARPLPSFLPRHHRSGGAPQFSCSA
jgi:hypothetical protein